MGFRKNFKTEDATMTEPRMKLPLFDDYWIDFRYNAQRRWFAPEPYSLCQAGPYASMFYDPERKVYRIYYEVLADWGNDDQRQLKMMESTDLKTFTPVFNREGSDVLYYSESGIHGASVLYDPFAQDNLHFFRFSCTRVFFIPIDSQPRFCAFTVITNFAKRTRIFGRCNRFFSSASALIENATK